MDLIILFIRSKVSKLSQAIAMLAQLTDAPSSLIKILPQASIVAPVVITSSTRSIFTDGIPSTLLWSMFFDAEHIDVK